MFLRILTAITNNIGMIKKATFDEHKERLNENTSLGLWKSN
jgi:hypothetical protein